MDLKTLAIQATAVMRAQESEGVASMFHCALFNTGKLSNDNLFDLKERFPEIMFDDKPINYEPVKFAVVLIGGTDFALITWANPHGGYQRMRKDGSGSTPHRCESIQRPAHPSEIDTFFKEFYGE